MDRVSKPTRSRIMSRVRSKDTRLEQKFRKQLWGEGIRYRKNNKNYFGKPDILIKKFKLVIFIDSCFWHGCKEHLRMPQSNKDYWKNKIEGNIKRDNEVNRYYKKQGWRNIRIWEHQLKNEAQLNRRINSILILNN